MLISPMNFIINLSLMCGHKNYQISLHIQSAVYRSIPSCGVLNIIGNFIASYLSASRRDTKMIVDGILLQLLTATRVEFSPADRRASSRKLFLQFFN